MSARRSQEEDAGCDKVRRGGGGERRRISSYIARY
jgi:hypothetical protein